MVSTSKKTTKGIILAGGTGTRLYPLTLAMSKQLLPVYDKPMIFYPLSVLLLAGIRDILIISTPHDLPNFKKLLKDGSDFGVRISYAEQASPDGIAQAFIIGSSFIGSDDVALVLGDNIFHGDGLMQVIDKAKSNPGRATIFGCSVKDPERFGVIGFDADGKATSIEEKPQKPKSSYAVTGLYFFDNRVVDFASKVRPSNRGELEITSINQMYLEAGDLDVQLLGSGFTWLDAGTIDSLADAGNFIKNIKNGRRNMLGEPEKIAYMYGWIDEDKLLKIAKKYGGSPQSI